MRLALIADLHSNLAALDAVIDDLSGEGPDAVVCLGDLVGYNAEPEETVARLRGLTTRIVAGNHDRDVARSVAAPGTHSVARLAQTWTAERLGPAGSEFLRCLPAILVESDRFVAVHGCYLNDTYFTGYVTSTMLEANLAAVRARASWPRVAFCGHTHVAMCGWLHAGAVTEAPRTPEVAWPRNADAVLINPGAVGQPRDGDPRAAYAIVDLVACSVRFKRVSYDVRLTAARIHQAGLPAELADRLLEGR